jgi:large subunit ribosomal protein L18
MINKASKRERTQSRHRRIRKSVLGTKHLYAQFIDDLSSQTLVSCSTLEPSFKKDNKVTWSKDSAKKLGGVAGKVALGKGISTVVFDRGGFKYQGKVALFADGAREAGLKF